jgi:acyl-CoA-binding protein
VLFYAYFFSEEFSSKFTKHTTHKKKMERGSATSASSLLTSFACACLGAFATIKITQRLLKREREFPLLAWGTTSKNVKLNESSVRFQQTRDRFDDVMENERREGGGQAGSSSSSSTTTTTRTTTARNDLEAIAGFEAAAAYAATRIAEGAVPEDCILELYGIYKQATKGDCDVRVRPTRLDVKGYAKFTEWMKHKGMAKVDACRMYVRVLESRLDDLELLPSPKKKSGGSGKSGGGAFGRSQSTMRRLEGEDGEGEEEGEETSLIKAAKEGDFDKLLKCLRAGADANQRDAKGRTPLMFAADTGDVAITIQLMQLDADIGATDEKGKTALHYAAICEQVDVAEVLLEAGADPEVRDANGTSASDLGVYELVKKKANGELASLDDNSNDNVEGDEEVSEEEEEDFDLEEIERQALEKMAAESIA